MHLVIVTNILAPYRVGLFEEIERHCARLTILLLAVGHKERHWELPSHRLQVEVLPGWQLRRAGRIEPIHLNRGMLRRLLQLRPDCVLSGGFAPGNVEAWLYCQLYKRPFLNWGELALGDGAAVSAPRRTVRKLLCSYGAGAIASSTASLHAYRHYGAKNENSVVALMPIDVDFFRDGAETFRMSAEFKSMRRDTSWPRLIVVGTLERRKGYSELFRIYARITQAFPAASLWIAGDGASRKEYEDHCRRQGWDRVHFLGFMQPETLIKYYAAADVFVFPTLYDPYGAVIAEAMAARVPVVASVNAAATGDLIEPGLTGFQIDPRDAESSAGAVARAINLTPEMRSALLDAAATRVTQASFPKAAQRMMRHIRGTVGPRKAV